MSYYDKQLELIDLVIALKEMVAHDRAYINKGTWHEFVEIERAEHVLKSPLVKDIIKDSGLRL